MAGARWAQEELLAKNPKADVRVFVIWFRMYPGDAESKWPRELLTDSDQAGRREGGSWWSFFVASALAKIALRTWAFERVIRRVRQRKAAMAQQAAPLDVERARLLVEAFMRYRIYLFSSKNECLYDSLALIEFLARNGIYADWVFGVQTRPFAAHCWVQHGDTVFNDTVEHVSGYTPIMVV